MRTTDEFGAIASALNQMAARVSQETATLTGQNETLERAVAERTVQLERLLEAAHNSEKNRRQLLADVSHELRTPLTIIKGEADVALRGARSRAKPMSRRLSALETLRCIRPCWWKTSCLSPGTNRASCG